MKMIFENAFANMRKGAAITLLICLMLSVGQFLVIGSVNYFSASDEKLSNFRTAYSDDETRLVFSAMGIGSISRAESGGYIDDYLAALREHIRAVVYGTRGYDYYILNRNMNVYVLDFAGRDNSIFGYGDSNNFALRDSAIYEERYATLVKNYAVSPGFFEKFAVSCAMGKDFSDFVPCEYSDTLVLPVVVGYDYAGCYSVGDRLDAVTMTGVKNPANDKRYLNLTFEVCGILEPGSAILSTQPSDSSEMIGLDSYMFIPAIDYTALLPGPGEYTDEYKATAINVGYTLEGVAVVPTEEMNDFKQKLSAVELFKLDKYGGGYGQTMVVGRDFSEQAERYFNDLKLTSVMIVACAAACLAINVVNKLVGNFKRYAVHLVSGATVNSIRASMITETLMLVLFSDIVALVGALLLGSRVFTYTQSSIFGVDVAAISPISLAAVAATSAAVAAFALFIPLIKLRRTEFDTVLRDF